MFIRLHMSMKFIIYCISYCEGTKMKLPSHAQQLDAAESGPAHSEWRIVNNQENVRIQA